MKNYLKLGFDYISGNKSGQIYNFQKKYCIDSHNKLVFYFRLNALLDYMGQTVYFLPSHCLLALSACKFLARYRAYVIVPIFFRVSTITFERINRLTSNFAHLEIGQK